MEDEKFKKKLIESLEDDEVISILKKIFSKKIDSDYIENNEYLKEMKRKIESYENDNRKLKDTINEKDKNIIELISKIKKVEDELEIQKSEVERLQSRFMEAEEVFVIYKYLDERVKVSMRGIFKGNTVEEFIYCGVQKDNVEAIWEYIKREAMEENDIKSLKKIFEYFFYAYNKTYDSPIYERINTQIEEQFDEDKHIRVQTGKVSGHISQILFEGYRSTNNNKIVKKSVIKI